MAVIEELQDKPASWAQSRLLNRHALLLAFVIAIVPNLVFLIAAPWFLIRRMLMPPVYLVAVLIALVVPWPLALLVFVLTAAADAFFIFSYIFDLPARTTFNALRYASDIDIKASVLYVGVFAYFAALPVVLTVMTRLHRPSLRAASPLLAALLAFGIAGLDYATNGYKPLNKPVFESAMQENGLTAETILARDRNLLVVIVEGMGAYANSAERQLLSDRLGIAAAGRFAMRHGTSNYYGSTTGAESRELCGRWATYVYYLGRKNQDCLPRKLADGGYRTTSYHAGGSRLFSRRIWYPRIGIQEMTFAEDIKRDRGDEIHAACGSVFRGICDDDVGAMVQSDLLQAGNRRGLFYWLTLNSHIPYEPVPGKPLKCRTPDAAIGSPIPCELTEIWGGVFDRVAGIAADPAMPPLDILVVGDHNTPMWSRDAYSHFIQGKVDWYYLEDQRPLKQASSRAAASG